MKAITRLVLSLLLTTLAITSAYARPQCGLATLNGSYAFTIHGQIFTPTGVALADGIALTHFDGKGYLTQVDAVAHNGSLPEESFWRSGSGNYTLDSDCKGTMSITSGGMTLNLLILVAKNGRTIHTVVTNPGFAITSDAELIGFADLKL
jgi:hypothetical protein